MYGTGTACIQCKSAKLHCSLVQGQRKPTEAAGSSAVAAVIIKTTKSTSPIKVDEESKDEGEMTPAQSKGKVHAVPKNTGSKSEARKTRDALAHHLSHLHSQLFQI